MAVKISFRPSGPFLALKSGGWALAIITPAVIDGLPNASATRCAPFQWYWKASMMEMEVMDFRRSHLADTTTSNPFIVKRAPHWFEKVESKVKRLLQVAP
jgi:hypothetical protein